MLFLSWKRQHEFCEVAEFCTTFGSRSDRRIASVVAISHAAPQRRTPNGLSVAVSDHTPGQTEELDRNQLLRTRTASPESPDFERKNDLALMRDVEQPGSTTNVPVLLADPAGERTGIS